SLVAKRTNLDGVARPGAASWRVVALRQPETALLPADQAEALPEDDKALRTPGDTLRARWDTRYTPDAVLGAWPDGAEKGRGALQHDAKGEASITLPALAPGAYRIHYETTDDFGATYETSKDVIVAGKTTPVALPLALLAEQESVTVGGTARLLVHS